MKKKNKIKYPKCFSTDVRYLLKDDANNKYFYKCIDCHTVFADKKTKLVKEKK